MATLAAAGIRVEVAPGWEGRIDEGGPLADGARRRAVVHLANFPLPAERADFGGGAVETMEPGDAMVILFEFGAESVGTALFSGDGLPRDLRSADFSRDTVQRPLPGHGGLQRFFVEQGRPFCLYVVVGSHIDRADVIPAINQLLAAVEISP